MNKLFGIGAILTAVVLVTSPAAAQSNPSPAKPCHCSIEVPRNPTAPYPDSMKGSGVHGTVLIQAVVDEDGCVQEVRVVRKLDPKLDEIAKETAESWKFLRARKDGKPVKVLVQMSIEFKGSPN